MTTEEQRLDEAPWPTDPGPELHELIDEAADPPMQVRTRARCESLSLTDPYQPLGSHLLGTLEIIARWRD